MSRGFTLVELIVAMALFIVIMTISMGSIVNIFDSNRKARTLKTAISNINLAVENISRELRFGSDYDCGASGVPLSCSSGDTEMTFTSSNGTQITYEFDQGAGDIIQTNVPGVNSLLAGGTGSSVVIDDMKFYVVGAESGDSLQPRVLIKLTGHAGTGSSRSDFTIQTLVSQRSLDL